MGLEEERKISKILMCYLEKAADAVTIQESIHAIKTLVQEILEPAAFRIVVSHNSLLLRVAIEADGSFNLWEVKEELPQIKLSIDTKKSIWTEEETQKTRTGTIVLIYGGFCWGCICVEGVTKEISPNIKRALTKATNYFSVQAIPYLEQHSFKQTALSILNKDALIILANELKTPLTIAASASQLLQQKMKLHDKDLYQKEYHQFFGYLEQNLYATIRLSENMLEIGRLECGYAVVELGYFELGQCLSNIIDSVIPYAKQQDIKFEFKNQLKEPIKVLSNLQYFSRMVLNFLVNAMTACEKVTNASVVTVTLLQVDDFAHIMIRDTGACIPKKNIPHLFEKLWQPAEIDSLRPHGDGLRLYLCKLIADKLRIHIDVESTRKGACFTLRVPLKTDVFQTEINLNSTATIYQNESWEWHVRVELADFMLSKKSESLLYDENHVE